MEISISTKFAAKVIAITFSSHLGDVAVLIMNAAILNSTVYVTTNYRHNCTTMLQRHAYKQKRN